MDIKGVNGDRAEQKSHCTESKRIWEAGKNRLLSLQPINILNYIVSLCKLFDFQK